MCVLFSTDIARKKPTYDQFLTLTKISIVISCLLIAFGIGLFIWYLILRAEYEKEYDKDFAEVFARCDVYGRGYFYRYFCFS